MVARLRHRTRGRPLIQGAIGGSPACDEDEFALPCQLSASGVPAQQTEGSVLSDASNAGAKQPATQVTGAQGGTTPEGQELLDQILTSLDDNKAEDVVTIDLAGRSSVADHIVVASGRSTRQVSAIAENLIDSLKALTGTRARAEGLDTADWVLIDAGDVIVHIFRPEVRDFYQIEKMWLPAPAGNAAAVH